MKLICKQCGQEFELTQSEWQFFRDKGLHQPKRCMNCRRKNRYHPTEDIAVPRKPKKHFSLSKAFGIVLLISCIVFAVSPTGRKQIDDFVDFAMSDENPVKNKITSLPEQSDKSDSIAEPKEETPAPKVTYVLNTYRNKFHKPNCSSVYEMNPQNRQNFYGTREEAVAKGYSPCGNCKP